MKFNETELRGVFVVDIEPVHDERGYFARTWSNSEFRRRGLNPNLSQCSISFNRRAGTIRGMHWQDAPCAEAKLVRCSRGSLRDVIVDLRPDSETFLQWTAVMLSPGDSRMVYVPEGCAHGFETTMDDTEVIYQISRAYVPACARGF